MEDGVYTYNPEEHSLTKVFDGDHRDLTGTQTVVVTKCCSKFPFHRWFKYERSNQRR